MTLQNEKLLQEVHIQTGELHEISRAYIVGDTFLYSEPSNKINFLNLSNLKTSSYTDKKVTGVPKCFAISPDETNSCVGYDDGKIAVFNSVFSSRNLSSSVNETKLGEIKSIEFIDTTTYVFSNGPGVYKRSMGGLTQLSNFVTKDKPIFEQPENHINKLYVPPIFKGKTICYPQLQNIICALSNENVTFYKVGERNPLFSIKTIGLFAFGSISVSTFSFAVVEQEGEKFYGKIYDYQDHSTEKSKFEIPFKPQLVSFLSDTIVAFIKETTAEEKAAKAIIIDTINNKSETMDTMTGIYIPSTDVIYCINNNSIYKLKMLAFRDHMSNLEKNPDAACEYCSKAYNSDPWSIIGLSKNEDYRRLQIEKELSRILVQKCETELTNDVSKASAIMDDMIARMKSMSMKNAITNEFMVPFENAGAINEYFQAIMKADPDAKYFVYKKPFVQKFLERKGLEGFNEFVLRLPDIIAPTAMILSSASQNNNVDLMYKIYLERLDDVISALNILAYNNKYETIVETCQKRLQGEIPTNIIKWLLAISEDGAHFPRLTSIVQQEVGLVATLLRTIMETVLETKIIPPAQFANAVIIAINDAKLPADHDLFKIVVEFTRKKGMELFGTSLNILLPLIFSEDMKKDPPYKSTFIDLLHEITKLEKIPIEFKKKLIPLCESYGFVQAKHEILLASEMFSELITFHILEQNNIKSDIFQDIMTMYNNQPKVRPKIQEAIIQNIDLLVSKDITKLIQLVKVVYPPESGKEQSFPDKRLVNGIKDSSMKNYFIREFFRTTKTAMIPDEYSSGYINFLCQYYPSEVRDFIDKEKNPDKFQEICRKEKINDACAIIDSKTTYLFGKFATDITNYFDEMTMRYVDKKDNVEKLQNNLTFLVKLFDRNQGTPDENLKKAFADAVKSIARNWAIPIYAANQAGLDIKPLQDNLKLFCIAGYAFVPFDELLTTIVGEFGELSIGLIRSTIRELVKDYSYDVDTSAALTNLIMENEADAYNKYIEASTKGVEFAGRKCDLCQKSLTEGLDVTLFPCGHIFHGGCTSRTKCPVCFKTDAFEEPKKKGKTISNRISSRLASFEEGMLVRQEEFAYIDDTPRTKVAISDNIASLE